MITRHLIKKAKKKAAKFFINQQKKGNRSSIYSASKYIIRSSDFSINYKKALKLLNNINFFYDNVNKHWAETDGKQILLNTYKNFDDDKDNILTNTLIHESLHNIIYRTNRHLIPEEKEHKIMGLIKPLLI